ncbi:plectin [Caerostris darwini]|uniref:Plectin n=1 Tax=Caerostris darwini TaxID=1538125 RepID=A0AAV4RFY0_9ARAC|nr:plectin [Caerostris darwini]
MDCVILLQAGKELFDLFVDLRDGHNLISLLEVLSSEILPREKGSMRFHMLQNVQIALNFLRFRKIKLVNIRAEDIVDGNPKLTLGLIWTIILHFQDVRGPRNWISSSPSLTMNLGDHSGFWWNSLWDFYLPNVLAAALRFLKK